MCGGTESLTDSRLAPGPTAVLQVLDFGDDVVARNRVVVVLEGLGYKAFLELGSQFRVRPQRDDGGLERDVVLCRGEVNA